MKTTNSVCVSKLLTTTIASNFPLGLLASCNGERDNHKDTHSKVTTTTADNIIGLPCATTMNIEASFPQFSFPVSRTNSHSMIIDMEKRRFKLSILVIFLVALGLVGGCATELQRELYPIDQPTSGVTYTPAQNTIELCSGFLVDPRPTGRLAREYVTVRGVELLVAPVNDACISSGVGIRRNNKKHKGVDYANKDGGPITAAGDGTVHESRIYNGYGNTIVIKHSDSVYTLYAHLKNGIVSAGDTVSKGQVIGQMGRSGTGSGVHLHYEILVGNLENLVSPIYLNEIDPFDERYIARN